MAFTAEEYFQRGLEKYEQGLLEEAIAEWTEAIRLDPNDTASYVNRGIAKSELGDNLGAILDFDKAIELDPNNALAYGCRDFVK